MIDPNLVDSIRKENYTLQLYMAYKNDPRIIPITMDLIKDIQEVYRYIEPSHFNGKLLIYRDISYNKNILTKDDNNLIYHKDSLTNLIDGDYCIETYPDGRLYLMRCDNVDKVLETPDVLFYSYHNKKEFFSVNNIKTEIVHFFNCSSIYSLHYHQLIEALNSYKTNKIRQSTCTEFAKCWFDANKIFFVPGPEKNMQISLEQHLMSAIRGVTIVREYNLGATKPVDLRVSWNEASKAALIEIKWLGKSKGLDGKMVKYSDARANDGAKQLKEYLDLDKRDSPSIITKGYLVIIDGRRRNTNSYTTTISQSNGLYYSDNEIVFRDGRKYHERLNNYERPVKMFSEPLCS